MNARVIMTEEEWDVYKRSLNVPKNLHSPQIPPSFPVMVFTHIHPIDTTEPWERGVADHAFIELADLKRMLAAT